MLIGHGSFDGYDYKMNLPGPDLSGIELGALLEGDRRVGTVRRRPADPALMPTGDQAPAQHRPAAVQHRGPRVVQGTGLLAQGAPAAVQLLEGVLDHVLRGGQVTDHEHREPDQAQVVLGEQLGHRARRVRGRGRGQPRAPVERRARTADDVRRVGLHV